MSARSSSGCLRTLSVSIEESAAAITHDPLPTIACNPLELAQVFQNLIANAIKFKGRRKPEIHVAAQRQAGGWQFSVRDNGIGIDPQFADRIFMIFQRLHTREQYPGHGHWIGNLQEGRGVPRRPNLGRVPARKRLDVLFYDS